MGLGARSHDVEQRVGAAAVLRVGEDKVDEEDTTSREAASMLAPVDDAPGTTCSGELTLRAAMATQAMQSCAACSISLADGPALTVSRTVFAQVWSSQLRGLFLLLCSIHRAPLSGLWVGRGFGYCEHSSH